jgi:hypothetical protein
VTHAYNPIIQEGKAGGSQVLRPPLGLHSEFQARLYYLKTPKRKKRRKERKETEKLTHATF